MARRTTLARNPMAIFVAGTYACTFLGLWVSAFVRAPGVSTFYRRTPPAQQPILLQHGGGLQGGSAQESTASDTERAMRRDDQHGESEGGSSDGTKYTKQYSSTIQWAVSVKRGLRVMQTVHRCRSTYSSSLLGVKRGFTQNATWY